MHRNESRKVVTTDEIQVIVLEHQVVMFKKIASKFGPQNRLRGVKNGRGITYNTRQEGLVLFSKGTVTRGSN